MSDKMGPLFGVDGTILSQGRAGNHNEKIVGQAHGKYYEAVSRGGVYCVTTGATGRAPGTALGVTPPILLYNPAGSVKRLKIMRVTAGYISGTLGAGTLFHAGFTLSGTVGSQSGVIPVVGSGAALTPINMDLGTANSSAAIAFALGTLNANPVFLYPFAILNAMLASTATNPSQLEEDVDGGICLEPGSGWCLEGVTAAGSTPLLSYGVEWEEVGLLA